MPDFASLFCLAIAFAAACIDAISFRIPDWLIAGGAFFLVATGCMDVHMDYRNVLAAAGFGEFLFLAGVLSGKGIGLGDVKLGLVLGFGLGPERSWITLAVSACAGLAAFMILRGRHTGATIPFAPALCMGVIAAVFTRSMEY